MQNEGAYANTKRTAPVPYTLAMIRSDAGHDCPKGTAVDVTDRVYPWSRVQRDHDKARSSYPPSFWSSYSGPSARRGQRRKDFPHKGKGSHIPVKDR